MRAARDSLKQTRPAASPGSNTAKPTAPGVNRGMSAALRDLNALIPRLLGRAQNSTANVGSLAIPLSELGKKSGAWMEQSLYTRALNNPLATVAGVGLLAVGATAFALWQRQQARRQPKS